MSDGSDVTTEAILRAWWGDKWPNVPNCAGELARAQQAAGAIEAEIERLRDENEAWRRGECTCRDDHASWCPIYEVERSRGVETAARALVNAHGPTPVPAWVRLRVDDLKAALDITALPEDRP